MEYVEMEKGIDGRDVECEDYIGRCSTRIGVQNCMLAEQIVHFQHVLQILQIPEIRQAKRVLHVLRPEQILQALQFPVGPTSHASPANPQVRKSASLHVPQVLQLLLRAPASPAIPYKS